MGSMKWDLEIYNMNCYFKTQIGWAPLKLPETAQLVTSQEFSIPNPFPQTKRLEKIGDVI